MKLLVLTTLASVMPRRAGDAGELENLMLSYPTLDEAPEAYRALYTADDNGVVTLNMGNLKTTADTESLQEALRKSREDVKALKAGDYQDSEEVAELKASLATITAELDSLKGTASADKIDAALKTQLNSTKILENAIPMIKTLFGACAINEAGVLVTAEGKSVDIAIAEAKISHPFLWPVSQGAGASGGKGGTGHANPFAKATWSMSEQGRILREYGQQYTEQLARSAGTMIGGGKGN